MTIRFLLPMSAVATLLLLSGCDDGGMTSTPPPPPPPQHAKPNRYVPPPVLHRAPAPSARVQSLPGLEGVIGASEPDLARQFGIPRLTVWEGDARKLQFSGPPCVLDVYLYPPSAGAEPRATFVDARRATDGRDVDRAACIAALRGLAHR